MTANRLVRWMTRSFARSNGHSADRARQVRKPIRRPGSMLLESLENRELYSVTAGSLSAVPDYSAESVSNSTPADHQTARVMDPAGTMASNQWAAVGRLFTQRANGVGSCTATLISSQYILTAAHCVTFDNGSPVSAQNVVYQVGGDGGATYRAAALYIGGGYRGGAPFADGAGDIAVVQLSQPVYGVSPVAMSRMAPQVGQQVYIIGFGASGSGYYGETISGGAKRWGVTRVDGVSQTLVYWRYDYGESSTAHGDSGGPQLLCTTTCQIVSVTSGGGTANGGGAPNVYGTYAWNTRVDVYANAIYQLINGGRDEVVDGVPDTGATDPVTDPTTDPVNDTTSEPSDPVEEPSDGKQKKDKVKNKTKGKKNRRDDMTFIVQSNDRIFDNIREKNAIEDGSGKKNEKRGRDSDRPNDRDADQTVKADRRAETAKLSADTHDRALEFGSREILADAICSKYAA